MRTTIFSIGLLFLICGEAGAACTGEMVRSLRARGASPALIAKICGSYTTSSAPAQPAEQSSLCVTTLGVCLHKGPAGEDCNCAGPIGQATGVSH
jgi:hypothetical protein